MSRLYLTDFDRAVVCCFWAAVERGASGTMSDVRDELVARRIRIVCDDLGKRIAWLRRMGQLPDFRKAS